MKPPFVVTSLVLTVGYPSALVAEVIGVLPSSVVSFPAFVGCFVASGILAIAFRDYARQPVYVASLGHKPAPQLENSAPEVVLSSPADWTYGTLSA